MGIDYADEWDGQAATMSDAEWAAWAEPGTGIDVCTPHLAPVIAADGPVGEIGCGTGRLLHHVARQRRDLGRVPDVLGVDVSRKMVGWCWSKNDPTCPVTVELINNHPNELPAQWVDMGAVYSVLAFQHMPHDTKVRYMQLALDALRPGGVLVVQLTVGGKLDTGPINHPMHEHEILPVLTAGLRRSHGTVRSDPYYPTWRWLTVTADEIDYTNQKETENAD